MEWLKRRVAEIPGSLVRGRLAGRRPHTDPAAAGAGEQRLGDLDHDGQTVDATEEVHWRAAGERRVGAAEGGRRLRDRGQRSRGGPPVGKDAEELLEVDEERVIAHA